MYTYKPDVPKNLSNVDLDFETVKTLISLILIFPVSLDQYDIFDILLVYFDGLINK